MTDEELASLEGTNSKMSSIIRNDTDFMKSFEIAFDMQNFGITCNAYNLMFNDLETDKAYYYTVLSSEHSYGELKAFAHNIELRGIE